MSDFSDRPLVAASLTGMRSFSIDSLGRLTGVSQREVWRPGVNTAKCARANDLYSRAMADPYRYMARYTSAGAAPTLDEPHVQDHQVASLRCSCGYYAYFDGGANPYHTSSNLLGIVAATGVATVGSRGFRAERAEIVALVDPNAKRSPLPARLWRSRHIWTAVFAVWLVAEAVTYGVQHEWLFMALAAVCALVNGFASFISWPEPRMTRVDVDLVRRNYPNVPFYDSIDAALKAHPLTFVPPPSPETDDDFWTRSAS